MILRIMNLARYGVWPRSGLRTTSRFVNPASPKAWLMPRPPALSMSRIISVRSLSSTPVKRVSTFETADSLLERRLLGPLYLAGNAAWAWPMILI